MTTRRRAMLVFVTWTFWLTFGWICGLTFALRSPERARSTQDIAMWVFITAGLFWLALDPIMRHLLGTTKSSSTDS
jgi:hypothetical protein